MKLDFVCPRCHRELIEINGNKIICSNTHEFVLYQFDNQLEIPNLTWPNELSGPDEEFYKQYSQIAELYDMASGVLFETFFVHETSERPRLVELMNINAGQRILELSTGTGLNRKYIIKQVGEYGKIIALDLNPLMLEKAATKIQENNWNNVSLIIANGSYLPFPENYFDGLFHFGGINTFSEVERAFNEIGRVVKSGVKL